MVVQNPASPPDFHEHRQACCLDPGYSWVPSALVSVEVSPLPGLDEHRGHAGRGVQDLINLHLRPAVHTVPLLGVT